jgi:hypothetical protein
MPVAQAASATDVSSMRHAAGSTPRLRALMDRARIATSQVPLAPPRFIPPELGSAGGV